MTPKDKLWSLVETFVQDQDIQCSETIYQTDRVMENAYEFIESLCDIVGYCGSPTEPQTDKLALATEALKLCYQELSECDDAELAADFLVPKLREVLAKL